LATPKGVERVDVRTAEEMMVRRAETFSALLAGDFSRGGGGLPAGRTGKARKSSAVRKPLTIRLEPNADILATLAKEKGGRIVVGVSRRDRASRGKTRGRSLRRKMRT